MAKCKLDFSTKENWIEKQGGLPEYIHSIACAILEGGGHTIGSAISIAISRVKVWSTGKGVDADTQAKAVAALAQWEKMKANNKKREDDEALLSRVDVMIATADRAPQTEV